jgi:hypothetical protein
VAVTDIIDGFDYDLCGSANPQRHAQEFTFILQAEIALAGRDLGTWNLARLDPSSGESLHQTR